MAPMESSSSATSTAQPSKFEAGPYGFTTRAWQGMRYANTYFRSPDKPPMKRIIICCDGTGQSANHGRRNVPSNIAKLSRAIAPFEKTNAGQYIQQVVFYDAGVGTGTDAFEGTGVLQRGVNYVSTKWQGGVGAGLDENVCEAYNFIVNNYNEGDELYFFGFSRGAFTARAAAGLVAHVGVCTNSMMDIFYRMYAAYKTRNGQDLSATEWAQNTPEGQAWFSKAEQNETHRPKIKVVGVFDTVGALGYPDTGIFDVTHANKSLAFHTTDLNPDIEYAFHALSLHEHRRPFSPALWSLPSDWSAQKTGTKKLIQCWFPGMHINTGGGSDDSLKLRETFDKWTGNIGDMEIMANVTFAWMVDRVRENTGLCFDQRMLVEAAFKNAQSIDKLVQADFSLNKDQPKGLFQGWGMGPHVDHAGITTGGSLIRTPGRYHSKGLTEEYLHPTVAFAYDRENKENPLSIAGFKRTKRSDGPGYVWSKTCKVLNDKQKEEAKSWAAYVGWKKVEGEDQVISIPEWIIPEDSEKYENTERWMMYSSTADDFKLDSENGKGEEALWKKKKREIFDETRRFFAKLDEDHGFEEWVPPFLPQSFCEQNLSEEEIRKSRRERSIFLEKIFTA